MDSEPPIAKTTKTEPIPLLEKDEKSDFTILVEGKELYIPRFILTYASPVFQAMLEGDFKEKEATRIELPGKKHDDVLTFLRCFHPRIMNEVTDENVLTVLPLAVEYQHTCMVEKCENLMIKWLNKLPYYATSGPWGTPVEKTGFFPVTRCTPTVDLKKLERVLTYILTGEKLDLKNIVNAAVSSNMFKTCRSCVFQKQQIFLQISPETRIRILTGRLRHLND